MADYSITSEAASFEVQWRRFAAGLRVCLPGVVDAFDADTQRARVVPATRLKITLGEQVKFVDFPVIENVPIVIPMAGGFAVTLPVKAGDPCLLIFADRDIAGFLITGKQENPGDAGNTTALRAHHLSDAICIPGIIPDTRVLPGYALDALELRDQAGNHRLRITAEGIVIQSTGTLTINTEGRTSINAASAAINTGGNTTVKAGNVTIAADGTLTDAAGINSASHKHGGVQSGGSMTSQAVP